MDIVFTVKEIPRAYFHLKHFQKKQSIFGILPVTTGSYTHELKQNMLNIHVSSCIGMSSVKVLLIKSLPVRGFR